MMLSQKKKRIIKIVVIVLSSIVVSIPTIILPFSTFVIYEGVFNMRFETPNYLKMSPSDFEGLDYERCEFESDLTLTGYKYSREEVLKKGVIVIAHGYGDGGHNKYLPYIDKFTKNGFYVFAYDAQGNDQSEGKSVTGFPQGIIDLDNAIDYAQSIEEYKNLPFLLFGHSWGAYSAGNVLNHHPEIKGAVLVAGFNESEDMLAQYPRKVLGVLVDAFLLPYVSFYETIKFGKDYASITAVDGMEKTDAKILIVHSEDDGRVPIEYGYDIYYDEFSENDRFEFKHYENKGHINMLFSDEAISYRESLENGYKSYLKEIGKRDKSSLKEQYFKAQQINKKQYFEPNEDLSNQMIDLFSKACA